MAIHDQTMHIEYHTDIKNCYQCPFRLLPDVYLECGEGCPLIYPADLAPIPNDGIREDCPFLKGPVCQ